MWKFVSICGTDVASEGGGSLTLVFIVNIIAVKDHGTCMVGL